MRFFLRFIGVLLAAGAFVAVVIDGARSIVNSQFNATPIRQVWSDLAPNSLQTAQAQFEAIFSRALWINGAERVLAAPFSFLLIGLAFACLFLGRRPRSRIGYRSRS